MLKKILVTIKNLIKYGYLLDVDDSGDQQIGTVSFLGKKQQFINWIPYGIISNAPPGSQTLLFNLQAQESNLAGISSDPKSRPKNLGDTASGVYCSTTGDRIVCLPNGHINIKSASGCDIDIDPSGNIRVTNANSVDLNGINHLTHVHGGVVPGGAVTGPPQN